MNIPEVKPWTHETVYKSPSIIITTHPTQTDLQRAKQEEKLIMCFVGKPLCVTDYETSKIWMNGWLKGLGIEASEYLVVYFVPKAYDVETIIDHYKKAWDQSQTPMESQGMTSLKGINEWINSEENES